ncbi:MAG: superoxide dismutase [Alistipes sp.]
MTTDTATQLRFTPQDLPYAYDALAPYVSEETLRFHHDKHYVGYVAKLNELLIDSPFAGQPLEDIILSAGGPLYNNAAQAWNHAFLFSSLAPKPQMTPTGKFLDAINKYFGSFDQMKAEMTRACTALFGSGWVWLVEDKAGRLAIMSEPNAGNPLRYHMRPLLCIDVWEHAYYIDYRNRRADAVAAWWNVIDWRVVQQRFEAK